MYRNRTLPRRFCVLARDCLVLLAITASSLCAQDKPLVVWYVFDFPPLHILQGPYKGQGSRDIALSEVIEHTPQFNHRITYSTIPRALDALRHTPNACQPSLMYTTERERFTHYSIPSEWLLPNGVIVLANRLSDFTPFLNANGELQLERFLSESTVRLGLNGNRSYGETLDSLLARHPDQMNNLVSSTLLLSILMKLATQQEFGGTLGYPMELHYLVQTGAIPPIFNFLPIAENQQDPLVRGQIGCSKTEQGRQFIEAFNAVLARPEIHSTIEAAVLDWLPPEVRDTYRRQKAKNP